MSPEEFRQVETWPIGRLKPYGRNARTHSAEQVEQIAASMDQWGWTVPILVAEDGMVIAGHGRLQAAQSRAMAEVPVIVARGWTDAQKRAYVLADNKLAENAGWDFAMLRDELADLDTGEFPMSVIGFSDDELEQIAIWTPDPVRKGNTDPDAVPDLPEHPASRPGDVWLLGGHRLLCGDATRAEDVQRLLAGATPHLMVTDPPYGVQYDPKWRQKAGVGSAGQAVGRVVNDDRADWREAWALFPGTVAYVWHAGVFAGVVAGSLEACRFHLRAQIVWVKQRIVLSRGAYHHQHEPCFYGVRDGGEEEWHFVPEHEIAAYAVKKAATAQWHGDRKQSTVWFIEHVRSDTGHGTQKPVECMRRPIENNSARGQAVYEPFSGSGTTIIAAEQSGRRCYALEIHPGYVDMAVRRWQEFTGDEATLEGDGRTFEDVAAEREALKWVANV